MRSVHVPDLGECLVGIDVSRAIGYAEDNNSRRAIKRHVPQKCMMRFEDVEGIVEIHVRSDVPQDDAILLKKPGLYCFLLRCKMPRAKPFMEWVVETVLLRELEKVASVIKEKDNQIQNLEFRNDARQHKTLKLSKEIDGLIKNRHVSRRGYFNNVLCFIKRIAKRFIRITLFDVNIGSLKNIENVLNFVTQARRRLTGVMIQILFIDGTYSRVKQSRNQPIIKTISA